jgi:5-(carboxyamino)imidazole ribonucleotide mutase
MPAGVAVGTLAIGTAGAKNAALLAASIIGLRDEKVREAVKKFRARQTKDVLAQELP